MRNIRVLGVVSVFYFQIVIPALTSTGKPAMLDAEFRHDHAGGQRQLSCFQGFDRKLLQHEEFSGIFF
jgi:hypothetical protein